MLTESAARWLLVLHTVLGAAAVAAATHLVVWLRQYLRGKHSRLRWVRRFATISLVLHALAFAAGNLMYPTYKVAVRTAHLENPDAILADRAAHARELDEIAAREGAPALAHEPGGDAVKRAAKVARWFDVKEHWIALGLLASAALVFLLAFWDPRTDGPRLAPVALALAVVIAGTVWLGAIIGVLTAAARAV